MKLYLAATAQLADGSAAEVLDVVLDPASRRVTHLVVSLPRQLRGPHLVPVDALSAVDPAVELSWTAERVAAAPLVEDIDHLDLDAWPHLSEDWDVGVVRWQRPPSATDAWPTIVGDGCGYALVLGPLARGRHTPATVFDRIPVGAAQIRRESVVVGGDARLLGRVDALVLDEGFGVRALHVDGGHLWARHHSAVPIDDVESIATDCVTLRTSSMVGYPRVRRHRATPRRPAGSKTCPGPAQVPALRPAGL